MTEDRTDDSTADATAEPVAQTVEEIEAIYKARLSGKDKAHNAEVASFKAQIAALQQAPAAAPVGESPEAVRIRQLEGERDAAIAQATAEALKRQYPLAADVLGDEITRLPAEKIAAIEARFDTEIVGQRRIEPNAAARGNSALQSADAKPMKEKTKDELLADLQKIAPVYQEAAKEGLL